MQDGQAQVLTPVTEHELIASYAGSAPGANKFVVTVGQPGVRIAFLETHPELKDHPAFRTAVTLHPLDAMQLARLLATMLSGIEKQILDVQVPVADPGKKDG